MSAHCRCELETHLFTFRASDGSKHYTMTKQSAGRRCVTLLKHCSVLLCGEWVPALVVQLSHISDHSDF